MNSSGPAFSCPAAVCCNRSGTNYIVVVLYPILAFICTLGNVLIIVAICRVGHFKIKDIFVMGMAFFDFMFVILFLPKFITVFAYYLDIPAIRYPADYMAHTVFAWLSYSCSQTSDIIVICFSFERLLAIRWPLLHLRIKEKRWLGVLLVVLAAVLGLVLRLEYLVRRILISIQATILLLCGRHMDNWIEPDYMKNWAQIVIRGHVVLQLLFSCVLLFFNIWILVTLRNRHQGRPTGKVGGRYRCFTSSSKADIRLLGSSTLFVCTQVPITLVTFLSYALPKGPHAAILAQFEPIVLIVNMINYSTDFLVYAGFSGKYRELIKKEIFGVGRRRTASQEHIIFISNLKGG